MHRISAVDGLLLWVYLQVAHSLVAVVIQYDMHRAVLFWGDAEDGGMTAACHLQLQMLFGQTNGIIMGMRDFFLMIESRRPFFWFQAQFATKGSQCERPIILRTSPHNPMTVADALEQ